MKAAQYRQFGGPEVLEIVEVPEPKMFSDLVLIKIESAALNPADLGFQSGATEPVVDTWFPVVPGWDLAGVVERVGEATTGVAVGDEVIGFVRGQIMRHGTYAEKIAAPPADLVRKPKNATWGQAAGLPLAGLTAYQAVVHALNVTQDEIVLVHGAAGGVGHLAVQIARSRGARVIGTGSAASKSFIESLGAEAVEYGDQLVTQVRAIAPAGVDVVLDTAGRGSLASTSGLAAKSVRVASVTRSTEYAATQEVFVHPDRTDLLELVKLVEDGHLTVHVSRSYPLAQASEAQAWLASGHARGKITLDLGGQG